MRIISVPWFIGQPMVDFAVPGPGVVVSPPLPDRGNYDTSMADGPKGAGQIRMARLYEDLAVEVAAGPPPLVYAGDCLSVIGVLAGLQRSGTNPTLYWFDAHGDFHTWDTTESSFLGGMPLAMLTGRGEQTIVEAVGLTPIEDSRVVLVDGRSLDRGEDVALAASAIPVMSVDDIVSATPAPGPIYVHVDVDIVNPVDLPAVNYPEPGGPHAVDVQAAVKVLADTGRVVAASVSSWNPALDGADRAAAVTGSIMDPFID